MLGSDQSEESENPQNGRLRKIDRCLAVFDVKQSNGWNWKEVTGCRASVVRDRVAIHRGGFLRMFIQLII